jgi:hypothetical protein
LVAVARGILESFAFWNELCAILDATRKSCTGTISYNQTGQRYTTMAIDEAKCVICHNLEPERRNDLRQSIPPFWVIKSKATLGCPFCRVLVQAFKLQPAAWKSFTASTDEEGLPLSIQFWKKNDISPKFAIDVYSPSGKTTAALLSHQI